MAEHLKLTKGTVSRALNGYSDISDVTRLRVLKAAEQMGYRPLSQAQAIRTGRSRSIGLVLEIAEHDGHRPFLADFLAGLSEAASREGWTMSVATAETPEDTLRLLQSLAAEHKADGFILPRTRLADPRIAFLQHQEIPFVLFGRGTGTAGGWYDIDSGAAMQQAVARLAALGHRRIGFVPGSAAYTYSQLRLDGYRRGMAKAGLPADPAWLGRAAEDPRQGAEALRGLLAQDTPPTAVICAVDRAAMGAYAVARERGLRLGRDLSVIGYDGIPEGTWMDPPLTTFHIDSRAAGATLADMLIRLCRGAAPETLQGLGQARFLARGTHGAAPPDKIQKTTRSTTRETTP